MKHRLFILWTLVVLVIPNCYGQKSPKQFTPRQYSSRHYCAYRPVHCFSFGSNGNFSETTVHGFWGIVSWGRYWETKRKFIISSDPKIMFSDSLTIHSEISSSYQPVDSLIINVKSPYESLLYAFNTPNVGLALDADPIDHVYRIYCYDFQIVCADDSISRAFERDFNQSHQQVCEARVSSYKPQEVSIKEIRMKIYWNPDSGDTILKRRYPYANTRVKVDMPHDNVYTINLPQFGYKFLTYKRYDRFVIRKKGKNKIVFMKREYVLED